MDGNQRGFALSHVAPVHLDKEANRRARLEEKIEVEHRFIGKKGDGMRASHLGKHGPIPWTRGGRLQDQHRRIHVRAQVHRRPNVAVKVDTVKMEFNRNAGHEPFGEVLLKGQRGGSAGFNRQANQAEHTVCVGSNDVAAK